MNQINEFTNEVELYRDGEDVKVELYDTGYVVLTTVYSNNGRNEFHGNKVKEITNSYLKKGYMITRTGETEVGR